MASRVDVPSVEFLIFLVVCRSDVFFFFSEEYSLSHDDRNENYEILIQVDFSLVIFGVGEFN